MCACFQLSREARHHWTTKSRSVTGKRRYSRTCAPSSLIHGFVYWTWSRALMKDSNRPPGGSGPWIRSERY